MFRHNHKNVSHIDFYNDVKENSKILTEISIMNIGLREMVVAALDSQARCG